jgi:hypothetical protein
MVYKPALDRKSRCKCDLLAGSCADINCPQSLSSKETESYWVEGWALSKYSVGSYERTNIGSIIHNIKYQLSNYSESQRKSDADFIKNEVIKMIKWLYNEKNLPFDVCVSPMSHNVKPLDLAEYICTGISGGSIKYLHHAISEKNPLGSMKDIPKPERCKKTIGNYIFNCSQEDQPKKGVLIVDDVFDTGCTIKGISKAISDKFSDVPIFVVTVAYIGQMGRISAL